MSAISYFQRFSQKENHVTNNTLLVLRHLYRASPNKISLLLNALFEEEVPIGLEFRQQVKSSHSVPDALIRQQPFSLFVEAKHGGALNSDQIKRHVKSIAGLGLPTGSAILIGLTKEHPSAELLATLKAEAEKEAIRFFSVSYVDLVSELRKLCADYEQDLLEIIEDYESFLTSEGLLANPYGRMVVFPCGTSWAENIRFGAYYEPPDRPAKWNCRFLGIYHQKAVSHIGQIEAAAVCLIQDGKLVVQKEEFGKLTGAHRSRIQEMIETTTYYDLAIEPHRYYVVDHFTETHFNKASPSGMRGHRYFNLADYFGDTPLTPAMTADAVAQHLDHQTFE